MVELDYVVVGHATRDLKNTSPEVGGTATYAARTAAMLGCRVGVVTSAGIDLDLGDALGDALIAHLPASETTTFENIYTNGQRRQIIHGTAEPLAPALVPKNWRTAIAHIGPVAQECDPALTRAFEGAFVGVTPQGWMRAWDETGQVTRRRWVEAQEVLPHADAVVLSEEDVGRDRTLVADYAAQTGILALTQGSAGCTVFARGDVRHFAPLSVVEVDSTGAGDIFAAAFFYALQRGHGPWLAARFANCIAARSVTRPGLSGTPRKGDVARCRQSILGDEVGGAHRLRTG